MVKEFLIAHPLVKISEKISSFLDNNIIYPEIKNIPISTKNEGGVLSCNTSDPYREKC